jgi:hypothetical protein
MATAEVGLIGLKALVRDINRLADDQKGPMLADLKAAGRAAAAPVAARVQSTVPSVSGALAGSVRVTAARTGAGVRMGKAKVLYAGPVDFGGYPGQRPFLAGGRYLYPAGADLAATAERTYAAAVQAALDKYPWTNGTVSPEAVHD